MLSRRGRTLLLALVVCTFALSEGFAAQDEFTVAAEPCMAIGGTRVVIPVYVRDVSSTKLGLDQPSGKRIQGISFQIAYTPAEAVKSASIARAGVLESRVAMSEFSLGNANTVSYLGLFDEEFNTVQFHLDAPPPGDLVANVVLTLNSEVAPGTVLHFTFGGTGTTELTDHQGSVSENAAEGSLRINNGCAQVVGARHRGARK
jgi:hypothetical protein